MYVLVAISLFSMLLAYLEYKKKCNNGLALGFILLTIIMGLRFEYGNDFISYSVKFVQNNNFSFSLSDLQKGEIEDPIWFLLNRLFSPLGFQWLVAFVTSVNSFAYYCLIKKELPSYLWPLGLFIYFFTASFFPMELSMMRQGLAMALIVLAVPYIIDKEKVRPLVFLALALGIHSSALVCIPFILLLYLDFIKRKKVVALALFGLFIMFFAAKDFILNIMSSTLNSFDALEKFDDKYLLGNKYEASAAKSMFGLIMYFFPVVVCLKSLVSCHDERIVKYSILYIFGTFLFLTDQIIPMMGRLAWYFTIFSIVALPYAFEKISVKKLKPLLIIFFIVLTLKEYNDFFHADNWKESFFEFKTILDK